MTEWMPVNPCDKCKEKGTDFKPCDTTTCGIFAKSPYHEVRKALAARDKWWIEKIEELEDKCEILTCSIDCLNIKRCKAWQQLKKELANNG